MGPQRKLGIYIGFESHSIIKYLEPLTAANAPIKLDVPVGQANIINEPKARLKRGRPIGSKDKNPQRRKGAMNQDGQIEDTTPEESPGINNMLVPEETQVLEIHDNEEISVNYVLNGICWNQNEVIVDDIFAYNVALNVIHDNEDHEPKSIHECRQINDWPEWKDAIEAELNSLAQQKGEIVRYKARLVAQEFLQRSGIYYEETYSLVVDATTFRYLISLAVKEGLGLRLLDVVTAYLYGSLDNDIYMELPERFHLPKAYNSSCREYYSIKLNKSLYGLKQSGRMWYNRLSDYLLKEGYKNDPICPCIFMRRSGNEFVIIAVYVDDLNIIGTPEELSRAINCLKKELEMKDLGRTKYCLGLQVGHLKNGILVHQEAYIAKVLKRFYMDKSHPLNTPMVVRSLDMKKDPFRPRESDEELLGPEVPYLSAIGALMYLANHTRPDITFAVNLLARYSSSPMRRYWNGIKHILRYLRGTMDMGLFYTKVSNSDLIGYADAGYLSDPHNG
ncbi:UNVERIFIED_CONTAM: Copia protein [Sesamum latifolium]|uniref:Copia protein n=1 Tax=Sesamum latifolium TaxID=2727402 RepID=A0AAW2UGC4_9LAMI